MEQVRNQGNNQPMSKKKARVLSVRLSYEDYGKLFLECGTCGSDFPDYVRSKLTRDATKEEQERTKMRQELEGLRVQLKEAQQAVKSKAVEVDKLLKESATTKKNYAEIVAALKDAQDNLVARSKDATEAAQSLKKLQGQLEVASKEKKELRTALKNTQEQGASLSKELENVSKSAKQKETMALKTIKATEKQVSNLTNQVQDLTKERDGFKARLDKANAFLEEKSKGIFSERLPQF